MINFGNFGGRIEEHEFSLKTAAKREVKEEMGLEIEIIDHDPYLFYTEKEVDGNKISVVLAHFLAKKIWNRIIK